MGRITFYYRKNDEHIMDVKKWLDDQAMQYDLKVIDICLEDDTSLSSFYNDVTPAVQIGPYRLKYPFNEKDLQIAFSAHREQLKRNPDSEKEIAKKDADLLKITGLEKFSYWLSNNYPLFIAAIITVFLIIPFLAPVLMKTGHENPAKVIYRTYSLFCHELAYRSYYLFGEQGFYPRELAHIPDQITYEQMSGREATDTTFSRNFVGNSVTGYKIAICQRDIAIYGSLILAALVFHVTRKKIKSLPWYFWMIFAVLPIAIDGSTQLFSLGGNWPSWFPIRESNPALRTVTGCFFGLGTAWYVFPMMEESMKDTRLAISRKLAIKRRIIKIEGGNDRQVS
jgi:uncharacterized membrane protein